MSRGGRPKLYGPDDEELRVMLPPKVVGYLRKVGRLTQYSDAQVARQLLIGLVDKNDRPTI